jgi:hypothetical protein
LTLYQEKHWQLPKVISNFQKYFVFAGLLGYIPESSHACGLVQPMVPVPEGRAMANDSTTQLQRLIDRIRAGDKSARDELISRTYNRLLLLARLDLHKFPGVHALEETTDVLHDSLLG